jgi:hypothetical protein
MCERIRCYKSNHPIQNPFISYIYAWQYLKFLIITHVQNVCYIVYTQMLLILLFYLPFWKEYGHTNLSYLLHENNSVFMALQWLYVYLVYRQVL